MLSVNFENWGSLAELLRFWRCQLRKLWRSRRIDKYNYNDHYKYSCSCSYNYNYTTLQYANYTTLHCTALRYTTLRYTLLRYATLRLPYRTWPYLTVPYRALPYLTQQHQQQQQQQQQQGHVIVTVPLFCEFSTWSMHKTNNPYRGSVFSLKNHHPFSMVFAWLWGYEFAILPMFSIHVQHTCLKKITGSFVSARGGQVSQLLPRVRVAPVCATNKRKHVVSDGSIHISSELMLVAQLLGCTIYHHLPRDQGKNKF